MQEGEADTNATSVEMVAPVEVVVTKKNEKDLEKQDSDEVKGKGRLEERRPSLKHDMEAYAEAPEGKFFCLAGKSNSFRAKLVRCDREYYPEGDWTKEDTRYTAIAVFVFVAWSWINIWQDRNSFLYNSSVNYTFWLKLFSTVIFNVIISTIVGYFVVVKEWNIGYGRKLLHFCLFATPVLVNSLLGSLDTKIVGLSWLALVCQAYFILVLKPIRRRFPFPCMLIFRAFDRPNDRPYTIPWLWTQGVLGFIALLLLQSYLTYANLSQAFFLIPMLVNGLGDGLAEPVGIKFGKHKYQTRALWHKGRLCSGKFVRSFEGSACVFFVSILSVFAVYSEWGNTTRFIIALFLVPITLTAAEAFSPHTCDTPFIFLVSTALICFLFEGVDDNFDPFSPSYSS